VNAPKPFTPVEGLDHGAIKVWMWLRQDGKCLLCGEPIDLIIPRNRYGAASTEHKRPMVRGGQNGRDNLAVTHWECNKRRGSGTWLKQVRPPPGEKIMPYSGGIRTTPTVSPEPR
jgi:5-methylcytosine-specific restriction endonuclease McrA